MSPHVVKPPTVHWLVLAEEVSAVAAVNAMPSWTGKTSTLHITTPVWTVCVEQIKRLLSAATRMVGTTIMLVTRKAGRPRLGRIVAGNCRCCAGIVLLQVAVASRGPRTANLIQFKMARAARRPPPAGGRPAAPAWERLSRCYRKRRPFAGRGCCSMGLYIENGGGGECASLRGGGWRICRVRYD